MKVSIPHRRTKNVAKKVGEDEWADVSIPHRRTKNYLIDVKEDKHYFCFNPS